jgi:hypothetical protein
MFLEHVLNVDFKIVNNLFFHIEWVPIDCLIGGNQSEALQGFNCIICEFNSGFYSVVKYFGYVNTIIVINFTWLNNFILRFVLILKFNFINFLIILKSVKIISDIVHRFIVSRRTEQSHLLFVAVKALVTVGNELHEVHVITLVIKGLSSFGFWFDEVIFW